jgi:hypothetical protein
VRPYPLVQIWCRGGETHLVELRIDNHAFTFGLRNGNLITDHGAPSWKASKVKMTRSEFYDLFFFDSKTERRARMR